MSVTGINTDAAPCTQKAWILMCEKGQFTVNEIATALGVSSSNIFQLKNRLIKLSAIELIGTKPGKKNGVKNLYKVTAKSDAVSFGSGQGERPKNKKVKCGTIRQQVWNTLRMHSKVDIKLLIITTTGHEVSLRQYLNQLLKAGYLKRVNQINRRIKGSCFKYRLIRDTGRLHPTQRKDGLWDQNTQTFYPFNPSSNKGNANE